MNAARRAAAITAGAGLILLAIGFGVWSFMNYSAPHGRTSDLVVAIASGVAALALVGYEIYFLRKLKNVSYL